MPLTDKIVNKTSEASTRRRRLPEDARENILAAAETMLTTVGPQALKLAEVARAAGISNASVLHHFGAIEEVQAALMERMVGRLVEEILAITHDGLGPVQSAGEEIIALFDAFERKGAARLAAWLELRGEARRLTVVRSAVRQVIDARTGQYGRVPAEALEDFMLASITLALAVGLFGSTLAELMDKPVGRAREVALDLLLSRLRQEISVA